MPGVYVPWTKGDLGTLGSVVEDECRVATDLDATLLLAGPVALGVACGAEWGRLAGDEGHDGT